MFSTVFWKNSSSSKSLNVQINVSLLICSTQELQFVSLMTQVWLFGKIRFRQYCSCWWLGVLAIFFVAVRMSPVPSVTPPTWGTLHILVTWLLIKAPQPFYMPACINVPIHTQCSIDYTLKYSPTDVRSRNVWPIGSLTVSLHGTNGRQFACR